MPTLHEAIQEFRRREGLDLDGGDSKRWDRGSAFGLPFPIPNTSYRKPMVAYHDVHHVLAGYATDEIGEAEISAWCLATGGGPLLGHIYDLGALAPGLVQAPRRTLHAWRRGLRSHNVYDRPVRTLLDEDLDTLRAACIDREPEGRATAWEIVGLLGMACRSLLVWGSGIGPAILFGTVLLDAVGLERRPAMA